MTALDNLRADNLTTWLETEALKLGTANQRERWAANVLPDDELTQLARAELYKGFEPFARWHTSEVRKEMRIKLKHGPGKPGTIPSCYSIDANAPDSVGFEVADVAELDANAWDTLKQLTLLVSAVNQHPWMFRQELNATLDSFTHWATCKRCDAEIHRSGVKISIPWAGRVLVREFRL